MGGKNDGLRKWGIAVLIIGGLLAIAQSSSDMIRGRHSTSWPTVQGTVIQSEVHVAARHNRFSPRVHYEYVVDATTYSSNLVAVGDLNHSRASARRIVERYPRGLAVQVYYDPDNPSVSVVEPGVRGEVIARLIIGMLIFIAGVVLFSRRVRRPTVVN